MSDTFTRGGIRTRTYKSQAIVYFDGDKSESIFILKKGKVVLTYLRPETGEEVKEDVRPGEFFGVKSALGRYPREETAQTMGETVILILSPADFEKLVLGNVQVVKKMLRVFSNQLRRIGRAVREVMGETNVVDPAVELYKIGEFYLRDGKYQQALYAFKKYMEHYPDGKQAAAAMKKIRDIESGNFDMATFPAGDVGSDDSTSSEGTFDDSFGAEPSSSMDDFGSDDLFDSDSSFGESGDDDFSDTFDSSDDFDFSDDPFDDGASGGGATGPMTSFGSEMDSFVSSNANDYLFDDSDSGSSSSGSLEEGLARAKESFDAGDYQSALDQYESVRMDSSLDDEGEHQVVIDMAKCKKELHMLQEALSDLSLLVKENPRSPLIKQALFEVGQVYLKAGSVDKATVYLKKVAAMQPRDEYNQKALGELKKYRFD